MNSEKYLGFQRIRELSHRYPSIMRLLLSVGLALGLIFALQIPASAHVIDAVEFEFQADEKEWRLLGEIDIAFMMPEMRGVPDGLPLSRAKTLKAPSEELSRYRRETESTLRKMLHLSYNQETVGWKIEFPDFLKDPFDLPEEPGDTALLSVKITADARPGPGRLVAHWEDELGSEFIAVFDEENAPVVTAPAGSSTVLYKVDAAGVVEPPQTRLAEWLVSGFRHVVPLGLDHLLFILGLFLMAPKWKPLVGQSLLFTLAHSLTLALAVFGVISLPGKWVEVAIAASIAFIGFENLFVHQLGKQRVMLVFLFGLIHGCGFASVLGEKLEGLKGKALALPLLGFNVGVELAQITVLIVAFLLLWPFRRWTKQIQIGGSLVIALWGVKWVIERAFFSA
jgi:hydrogenase/urease accessory protein HupE